MTFLERLPPPGAERDAYVLGAIASGHLDPVCWVPVRYGPVELQVSADWLSVEGGRVPMTPANAQAAVDSLDALLPTPLIVRAIEAAARDGGRLVPFVAWPRWQDNSQLQTSTILWREGNIPEVPPGTLVAGALKDIVIAPRLAWMRDRVLIFGALAGGQRVQDLQTNATAHGAFFDGGYAHGVRAIRDACTVYGQAARVSELLVDQDLARLLSDEGPLSLVRYPTARAVATSPSSTTSSSSTTSRWTTPAAGEPLRLGHRGPRVTELQRLLVAAGHAVDVDGFLGEETTGALRAFQASRGLPRSGIVDESTLRELNSKSPPDPYEDTLADGAEIAIPPPLTAEECERVFGNFVWEPVGASAIRILGGWEAQNIRTIEVPQLRNMPSGTPGLSYSGPRGLVRCHRLLVDPLRELFDTIERRRELGTILTYDGAHVARRVVNGTSLSNHSWGCALDLNARWNGWGRPATPRGQRGTILPVTEIAVELGWGSGGVWRPNSDWMHLAWRGGVPWKGG